MLYSTHKDKIIDALDYYKIPYKKGDDNSIMQAYIKSTEAQEDVGSQILDYDVKQAQKIQQEFPNTNLNINKLVYLNHFLGPGNTRKYIKDLNSGGIDYADTQMEKIVGNQGDKISNLLGKFVNRMNSYKRN